jgi:hypothetical protein
VFSPPQNGLLAAGARVARRRRSAGVGRVNAAWSSSKAATDLTNTIVQPSERRAHRCRDRGLREGPPDVSITMAHHQGAKCRDVPRKSLISGEPSGDRTQDPLIKSRGAVFYLFDI